MDIIAIVASVTGAYITGWAVGYGFLAWRRLFESATN